MRGPWLLAALLALAAARRLDQDFEFDDDAPPEAVSSAGAGYSRRPRRYVYDPHNTLCRSLVCKKREICLLRDAFTALCATKKDILRKGDMIVSAGAWSGEDDDADDVFYDARDPLEPAPDAPDAPDAPVAPDAPDAPDAPRCVGCGAGTRAHFLCGSDNRTYSSLCRLDLHNCVRRPAPPVALACRGFCPCRPRRRPGAARRARPAPAPAPAPARRRASACALDEMANRLLDWFSVVMEEAGAAPPGADARFPPSCKAEVRWMFSHLDGDGDGLLSAAELFALRHDERERCLRPFLASCGGGGAGVGRGAWCGCLRRAARPCTALARGAARGAGAAGGYVPACDARGFYRPRQCHAALAVCWCVDAHGAELPGTRGKGEPACPPRAAPPAPPADDEDEAGSGDGADLRY